MVEYQVETQDPQELTPHPDNYRSHPPEQISHLKKSIEEHGIYKNVVTARDGTILAGHGVVQASIDLELQEVPIVRLDIDPDSPEAKKVLAGDNEIGRIGMRHDRQLADLLKDLQDTEDIELEGTGYDKEKMASLAYITSTRDEMENEDTAKEWAGLPDRKNGGGTQDPAYLKIRFEEEEKRKEFVEKHDLKQYITARNKQTWSARYPGGRQDPSSIKVVPGE